MARTFKLADGILFNDIPQAWRVDPHSSIYPNPISGMMAHDELVFLRWAGEHLIDQHASIIDMGPLAGSSTLALATGLRQSGYRNRTIIHSYDLWNYCPDFEQFFPGNSLKAGDNSLPLFEENIQDFRDLVEPHRGDIYDMHWDGSPIGILFLDAAKSPRVMAKIVREFLPSLSKNGVFVQQDYVSSQHPWIHIAQELCMDNFEVADSPFGGTVNFRCTDSIFGGLLQDDYFSSMEQSKAVQLLRSSASRLVGWERLCVELSESYYWLMHGAFVEAGSILERVCSDRNYSDHVKADVDAIQSYLSTKTRPYPEYLS